MESADYEPNSVGEIIELTEKEISSNTPHKSSAVIVTTRGVKNAERSEFVWKFTDDQGRVWFGSEVAEASAEDKGKFNLTLLLARAR